VWSDVLGITKSLKGGAKNFLVHFRGIPDEQWESSIRETVIREISLRFKKAEGRNL